MLKLNQAVIDLQEDMCLDARRYMSDVKAGKYNIEQSITRMRRDAQEYLWRLKIQRKSFNLKYDSMENSALATLNRIMTTHADVEARAKELLKKCKRSN